MGSNARNKTVLISGASSGIGFATTLRLAQNGWIVFAGVRKKSDYDRLKESHSNIYPVYLDVTKADQISKAIDIIKNMVKEAGLDALVNNSGAAHNGPIEFMPIEVVKEEFDVNVFGVYRLTQAALPLLRIGKPGRIINIGSLLGKATTAFSSSYCATKHALESLTVAMRLELSPMGIQVSLIGPGPVQSNFGTSALDVMDDFNNENKENSIYREYYAKKMMNTQDMFRQLGGIAVKSDVVAKQIESMLNTWWLRRRYCDTLLTWFMTSSMSWMPAWLNEWMASHVI